MKNITGKSKSDKSVAGGRSVPTSVSTVPRHGRPLVIPCAQWPQPRAPRFLRCPLLLWPLKAHGPLLPLLCSDEKTPGNKPPPENSAKTRGGVAEDSLECPGPPGKRWCWPAPPSRCKDVFLIEVYLIYKVVLVPGGQQSDSVICIYFFSDSFPL